MSKNQKSNHEQGMEKYFFRASAEAFKNIEGSPIAYWASPAALNAFKGETIDKHFVAKKGMAIGDNAKFLRRWTEISKKSVNLIATSPDDTKVEKWYPCLHGGPFRKWSSNKEFVVNWRDDGVEPKSAITNKTGDHWSRYIISTDFFFKPGINWTAISSSSYSARFHEEGFAFTSASMAAFSRTGNTRHLLCLVNSVVGKYYLSLLSPTLNYGIAELKKIPLLTVDLSSKLTSIADSLISNSSNDWNIYEISWDFSSFPLLRPDHRQSTVKASYQSLRARWREITLDMQRLEEDNNRIFINAYGLRDELTSEVPLNEITLTCNPHYRYGGDKTEDELEALLLADTMRELVSYAVGCMFGRYSLDKEGLILANQGETLADYLAQVPQPSFPVDDDNVIPVLDGDWFADDITLRFRQFLRVAFGDAHYEDNLVFIEQALNVKGKRNYSLRDYFLSDFYTDHVKRYKKRPIYWLFSSPKGSFNALIYMHRYRSDTVSVVLKYLRDYRDKLIDERKHNMAIVGKDDKSQGEKIRAQKEIERLSKVLAELEDYEREVLYPLATEQKAIDLDDGVKVNYLKFGGALKKIVGLDSKSED